MKVLHVITGLGIGGAENQLRLLLRHLPARYECEVVTLTNPGPVAEAIRAAGVPVYNLDMKGNRDLSAVADLVRLMRRGRFDIVHTHLYRACLYGRIAARLAGIRTVVATEHSLGDGLIEGRRTSRGVRALYRIGERLGTTTIAVSATVGERLEGWGVRRDRIRVVPNGIDVAEFAFDAALRTAVRERLGIAPDARVVGGVGRLVATKRFDRLVRAVAGLPGVTLLLAGDGPERPALEALAARLDVRAIFAGATTDIRGLLCAMDAFASPSEQETFGLAVLEAVAAGLPVAYTTCPPLEELPSEAAPDAVRVAGDDEAWRAALAASLHSGRRPVPAAVARYDIARLAPAVGDLYERTAQRRVVRTTYQPITNEGS
jgi:glycosyltransferase involved in cell wall biosynthesis